jgi:hypothetical protein
LVLAMALELVACGSNDTSLSPAGSSSGGLASNGGGATVSVFSGGGISASGAGGKTPGGGGAATGVGGASGIVGAGGVVGPSVGGVPSSGGASAPLVDAGLPDADDAAPPSGRKRTIAGVNVHGYPKPTAYGYTVADGKDRMGDALTALRSPVVRGGTIGDTTFLARLASFGVKEVVLLLSASAEGKPFDPAAVGPLLKQSVDAARQLGLTVQVEGLNEWDLFNGKTYNAGVLPSGMSASAFVPYTQKALYEAAHPLGISVLGPSVGHPNDPASLAFFPDVSAYVDIVNAHIYFTSNPEALPIATRVADHQRFQGASKPLWVTETGISSYGSVTVEAQADIIRRGLDVFSASKLIARAYIYELLENQKPGLSGSMYVPDDGEYHFGLFTFEGAAKPAAQSFTDFEAGP